MCYWFNERLKITSLNIYMTKIIYTLLLFPCILLSQTVDYFPIQIGNEYQYETTTYESNQIEYYKRTITNLINKEDGGTDIYFDNSKEPKYYKSKNGNIYLYADNKPYLWYDFTTSAIDTYYTKLSGIETNVIVNSFNTILFAKNTTARSFSFLDKYFNFSFGYHVLAEGLGIVEMNSHIMLPSSDRLIGCIINGVTYGTIVSIKEKPIDTDFELFQNHPNPFNPITRISFKVPSNTVVKLSVYDILGREIITLVNEEVKAGKHEIEFNGTDLPSGVYFYKIQSQNFVDTKKLVLIK